MSTPENDQFIDKAVELLNLSDEEKETFKEIDQWIQNNPPHDFIMSLPHVSVMVTTLNNEDVLKEFEFLSPSEYLLAKYYETDMYKQSGDKIHISFYVVFSTNIRYQPRHQHIWWPNERFC